MADLNFQNRTLYHGDNLDFLRGMNSETVHLIATDPPFNKNRDFHATPDGLARGARFSDRWSWARDVHEEWMDSIKDDWPAVWSVIESTRVSYGDDMAAFLCWLGVRLMEMHRILRNDGSIYLHCDPTASHYIKALMDGIFGHRSFQNEVTWQRTTAHSDAVRYGKNSDTILFYSKGDSWTWNRQYQDYDPAYIASHYRYRDAAGRLYRTDNLTATSLSGGGYEYEWNGVTRIWRRPRESMAQLHDEGRIRCRRNQEVCQATSVILTRCPVCLYKTNGSI